MRSTVDELQRGLDDLRSLLDSIEPVNGVLVKQPNAIIARYVALRRRFDYAAFVVALYAVFERFIEELAWSFAQTATARSAYSALPADLISKHLRESAGLLQSRLGDGRYDGLTAKEVVRNLNDCLSEASPYALNKHAIVAHELNLRADAVAGLLTSVGIQDVNAKIGRIDSIVEWYVASKELEAPSLKEVGIEIIVGRVKDLVDRRNEVAHRGGNPSNVIDVDGMREMLGFVDAYCGAVYAVVVGEYLKREYTDGRGPATNIGKTPEVIKEGRVLILPTPRRRLFVGQAAFCVGSSGVRWGSIQEIQVDDVSMAVFEPASTTRDVSVRLDFKNTKNTSLFVLDQRDDLVWAPERVS